MATHDGDTGFSEIQSKKSLVTDRLQKRDEERLTNIQNRKAVKQETQIVSETTDFFKKEFEKLQADIERGLTESDVIAVNERPSHFDTLALSVQKLQKLLTDSIQFLSSFSVQKAQDVVNQLKNSLEEKRSAAIPKKKFAFKSDKKKVSCISSDKVDAPLETVDLKPPVREDDSSVYGFSNIADAVVCKTHEDIGGKDVTLSSLVNCTILLQGSPTALQVDNLVNCRIFCGPISGSAFINGCRDCIFVLACQQFRVHTTTKTDFYLHVTSRAIIEDCNTVGFAPYNWSYTEIDADYDRAGLDRLRNNWDDVDDFNWLASDVRSPNWSIIAEENRVVHPSG